jgi:putative addiction module component (TIGR02574 family)
MTTNAAELLRTALTLDENDRAAMAGALIESLSGSPDTGVVEAWDHEIQRRTEELDSGAVATLPWSEVRQRLFRDR